MSFKKYSSIDNAYREKTVNYYIMQGHTQGIWRGREKIHGANFQFAYNGGEVKIGKRSAYLKPIEHIGFFRSDVIYDRYINSIHILAASLEMSVPDGTPLEFTIYGELYGGVYPHPDVEKDPEGKQVQKGIYYAPGNHFAAFDMKLNGEFVPDGSFEALMALIGMPVAPILVEGTFEEVMAYTNEGQSIVGVRLHGLPPIENNVMEGLVIKPIIPQYLNDGSRVILKNKNEKWSEKSNKTRVPKAEIKMTSEQKDVYLLLSNRVTENRLRNVISHFGNVTNKDFGKLLALMTQDIITEHTKEDEVLLASMEDKKERKLLTKMLNGDIATMVRKNFLNIIDGEF
jgi:Rnl2 family RNA ligase